MSTFPNDSDDICDPKWRLKCPRNFQPPSWSLRTTGVLRRKLVHRHCYRRTGFCRMLWRDGRRVVGSFAWKFALRKAMLDEWSLTLSQPRYRVSSWVLKFGQACMVNSEKSVPLTLSPPWCRLNRPTKVRNLKPWSLFVFVFALACERTFITVHSIESRCYRSEKYSVLQARPCMFQPGNFTGCGSEGVKLRYSCCVRLNICRRKHILL